MPNALPVVAVLGGLAALAAASRAKAAPAPSRVPTVPTSLPQLDRGIDDKTGTAVLTALTVETDPAKLVALAHGIEARYPQAAASLLTKAAALEAARPAPPRAPASRGTRPIGR